MDRHTTSRTRVAMVLVVALLAGCRAPDAATGQNTATGQRQGAVPVAVQTVARGSVGATLTYSGNIQSRAQVSVLPRATGRIEQLFVDVGSRVQAGDTIAVLDRAQLEAQTRQSEAALRSAQARLALLVAGARPEEVESARSALDSAQARLNQMARGGRAEDIASAQSNLEAAQAKLNQLMEGPTDAEVASARAAVESARANVQSSQERLDQLLAGGVA